MTKTNKRSTRVILVELWQEEGAAEAVIGCNRREGNKARGWGRGRRRARRFPFPGGASCGARAEMHAPCVSRSVGHAFRRTRAAETAVGRGRGLFRRGVASPSSSGRQGHGGGPTRQPCGACRRGNRARNCIEVRAVVCAMRPRPIFHVDRCVMANVSGA